MQKYILITLLFFPLLLYSQYAGRSINVYGSYGFTLGSDERNNSSMMNPGAGAGGGVSYSTNFKGILRFTFGINYLNENYSVDRQFDYSYQYAGVVGLPLEADYSFGTLGVFTGLQLGKISSKYIYYYQLAVGYNSIEGDLTIHFPDNSQIVTDYSGGFFNAESKVAFGKLLKKNALIFEVYFRLQKNSTYTDNGHIVSSFHWTNYGVALKYDFAL
jgi:hypothetical protein